MGMNRLGNEIFLGIVFEPATVRWIAFEETVQK